MDSELRYSFCFIIEKRIVKWMQLFHNAIPKMSMLSKEKEIYRYIDRVDIDTGFSGGTSVKEPTC